LFFSRARVPFDANDVFETGILAEQTQWHAPQLLDESDTETGATIKQRA